MPKNKEEKISDIELDSQEIVDLQSEESEEKEDSLGTPSYEELTEIKDELEKSLLRANADLDNALKRSLTEVEKAHKYGVEKLLVELLPVIDNLEHALNNLSEKATKEDKEGIELTLKSFESALDKFGMRPIYPDNEQFNPEKHEAVSVIPNEDKEDGMVGDIFQRGWELHNRILRPARVTVIKN